MMQSTSVSKIILLLALSVAFVSGAAVLKNKRAILGGGGYLAPASYGAPSFHYGAPYAPTAATSTTAVPKYSFGYEVDDVNNEGNNPDGIGANFGHQETRDGDLTVGSYFVHLPDGRKQTVKYEVDGDSGYQAVVTYERSNRRGRVAVDQAASESRSVVSDGSDVDIVPPTVQTTTTQTTAPSTTATVTKEPEPLPTTETSTTTAETLPPTESSIATTESSVATTEVTEATTTQELQELVDDDDLNLIDSNDVSVVVSDLNLPVEDVDVSQSDLLTEQVLAELIKRRLRSRRRRRRLLKKSISVSD